MKITVLSRFFHLILLLAILMAAIPLVQAGTLPPPRGGVSNGLSLWYRADMGVQTLEGGIDVSAWGDQSGNERHAYTLFDDEGVAEYPALLFQFGVLNGSSSIRFSTASVLGFDGAFLAGSDYTIFVLEGRDRAGLDNFFIGTTNACSQALASHTTLKW